MKKILVVFTLVMMSALVFAAGTQEGPDNKDGRGFYRGDVESSEAVTMKGVLVIAEDDHHYLDVNGKMYSLSARGGRDINSTEYVGKTVEVSGFLAEAGEDCDCDSDGHIFLEKAVVDGQELELDNGSGRNRRDDSDGEGRGSRDGRGRSEDGRSKGRRSDSDRGEGRGRNRK